MFFDRRGEVLFFKARRAARKQKAEDLNLDLIASLIVKDFDNQLLRVIMSDLALTLVRTQKTVESLEAEIKWDELDEFHKREHEKFVTDFSNERLADPNYVTLFVTMSKSQGLNQDDLKKRVAKKLSFSGLQSMVVAERSGTIWFIGMFAL